jgi:hypothetical protein
VNISWPSAPLQAELICVLPKDERLEVALSLNISILGFCFLGKLTEVRAPSIHEAQHDTANRVSAATIFDLLSPLVRE